MLLFGRSNGGAENIRMGYNPQTDTWRKLALDPVGQREGHIAVWTGSRMFTWGGKSIYSSQSQCNADGASYDPTTNTWEVVPAPVGSNPPKCRNFAVAVWSPTTGEVLIWGGKDLAGHLADGDAYKPATKTWRSLPAAPIAAREAAGGFFAGGKLHVFGGYGAGFLADGASFDPVANTWQKLPAAPTLTPRIHHLAVADSSGSAGAFWGGSGSPASTYFGDGMVFDGTTSSWTDISPPPTNVVPVAPREYSGGWFASGKLWFFGGRGLLNSYDLAIQDGAAYDVATKTWSAIPPGGPSSSLFMTPPLLVWTGSEAIVIAANYVGDNTTHGRIYRP